MVWDDLPRSIDIRREFNRCIDRDDVQEFEKRIGHCKKVDIWNLHLLLIGAVSRDSYSIAEFIIEQSHLDLNEVYVEPKIIRPARFRTRSISLLALAVDHQAYDTAILLIESGIHIPSGILHEIIKYDPLPNLTETIISVSVAQVYIRNTKGRIPSERRVLSSDARRILMAFQPGDNTEAARDIRDRLCFDVPLLTRLLRIL